MEEVVSDDGTPIAYERLGDGPPLVLVHGVSHDHVTTWSGVLQPLSNHFTVYAVDRRGHGKSGDTDDYALEREIEDLVAVVQSIQQAPYVFGHSFGGIPALEAARTVDMAGLMLYESINIGSPAEARVQGTNRVQSLVDEGEQEDALVTFLQDVAQAPASMIETFKSQPTWERRVAGAHTIPREVRAVDTYPFEPERFAGMETPIAVFTGGNSPENWRDYSKTVAEGLPDARLITLPGQGHSPMVAAPAVFVRELLKCLRGLSARP